MPQIKFSHPYNKLLLNGKPVDAARLLHVQLLNISDLSAEFIEYDTDKGTYQLPKKGIFIMLIFLKPGSEFHLFTTLRRYTIEKSGYYMENMGHVFDVVISQPKHEPAI